MTADVAAGATRDDAPAADTARPQSPSDRRLVAERATYAAVDTLRQSREAVGRPVKAQR